MKYGLFFVPLHQFHKEVGLVSERARLNYYYFRAKESLSCEIRTFFCIFVVRDIAIQK